MDSRWWAQVYTEPLAADPRCHDGPPIKVMVLVKVRARFKWTSPDIATDLCSDDACLNCCSSHTLSHLHAGLPSTDTSLNCFCWGIHLPLLTASRTSWDRCWCRQRPRRLIILIVLIIWRRLIFIWRAEILVGKKFVCVLPLKIKTAQMLIHCSLRKWHETAETSSHGA